MARARDLLYRFRPAGAPGSASATGVPTDRGRDLTAELEPVFARLAETQQRCIQIVERGRVDAAAIRARDTDRARALVDIATQSTQGERAAAMAQARQEGASASTAAIAIADQEAAAMRARADRRIAGYVDEIVASVGRLDGGSPPSDSAGAR